MPNTLYAVVVSLALAFFAAMVLAPLFTVGFRRFRRQGVAFALIASCFLHAAATKQDEQDEGEKQTDPVVQTNKIYNITYKNTKGATNPNPTTFTTNDVIVFVELADREDFTFQGWSPAGIPRGTASNVTVTAQWNETPKDPVVYHTVIWDLETYGWFETADGVRTNQYVQSVQHGQKADNPESKIHAESDWEFDCWKNIEWWEVTSNMTITAQWTKKAKDPDPVDPVDPDPVDPVDPVLVVTNQVTFVLGDKLTWVGGGETNQWVESGKNATEPKVQEKAGYLFENWSVAFTNVTSNLVVTAMVTNRLYTITYENLQGATQTNATVFTVEDAITFTPPSEREGYTFEGWSPTEIVKGTASNVVVTAQWKEKAKDPDPVDPDPVDPDPVEPDPVVTNRLYTITYENLQGAANPNPTTFTTNDVIVFEKLASSEGHYFAGWDPSCIEKGTAKDVTVTAKWKTTISVAVECDLSRGTVTGGGELAANKKLTLKAKAKKGYVFAGWYDVTETDETNFVSQCATLVIDRTGKAKDTAKQTVLRDLPGDRTYRADFITSAEDAASITASVGGFAFAKDALTSAATNLTVGLSVNWPVAAEARSATTVKVSGLPSGLTYKNGVISGSPKTASKANRPSTVKITVTTAGKSSATFLLTVTVNALPDWVVGSYTGLSFADAEGRVTNGLVTASVATTGKISAKFPYNGKTTSFTATGFASYDEAEGCLTAFLTAKVNKVLVTNELTLAKGDFFGAMEADFFDAAAANWKIEPWKTLAKALKGQKLSYTTATGETISLTVGTNGKVSVVMVTASGLRATSSTTLLPVEERDAGVLYQLPIYLAPKKSTTTHAEVLNLLLDGTELKIMNSGDYE